MEYASLRQIVVPAVEGEFKLYWPMIGGLVGLILSGLLMKWRGRAKVIRRMANAFIYFGIVGTIIYLFRYESAPYFGSPWLIWLFIFAFDLVILRIIVLHIIQSPRIKHQQKVEQIKSKYLPKQKVMRGK